MPKAFEDAVKRGGAVRTIKLPGGKYVHVVKDKHGKWVHGETHKKKGM